MMRRLQLLANRIDARTLRERLMLFAAAAATIVFMLYGLYLNPLLVRRAALRAQLSQQHDNIVGIDNEIGQRLVAFERDPDAAAAARLLALSGDTAQLATSLRAMQNGLVAPEQMAALLERILKANGRLQLVSVKTMPASPFSAVVAQLKARAPGKPEAAAPLTPVAPLTPAAPT
ncbi:MAG: hypothetical protein QFF03_00060, partial [Pseudomonadota bacterium]|nr:hypothetical protein [Pseudomonadota bacterium]